MGIDFNLISGRVPKIKNIDAGWSRVRWVSDSSVRKFPNQSHRLERFPKLPAGSVNHLQRRSRSAPTTTEKPSREDPKFSFSNRIKSVYHQIKLDLRTRPALDALLLRPMHPYPVHAHRLEWKELISSAQQNLVIAVLRQPYTGACETYWGKCITEDFSDPSL